jgi:hypothetical protein
MRIKDIKKLMIVSYPHVTAHYPPATSPAEDEF